MSRDVLLVAAAHHPSLEGRRTACLFPDEDHAGAPLTQEEIRSMSPRYSRLYAALVEAAAGTMTRLLGLPRPAAEVLAREGIVSPTHFFMDRLVRLHRSIKAHPGEECAVLKAGASLPEDMFEFRSLAQSSLTFNQAVLARQAGILSLPLKEPSEPLTDPVRPPAAGTVNYNNLLGSTLLQKVRRKAVMAGWKAVSLVMPSGSRPLPAHAMAYLTDPLKTAGFYAGQLEDVQRRVTLAGARKEPGLRRELRGALLGRSEAVGAFLDSVGMTDPAAAARAAESLAEFLVEAHPASLLEAAAENVRRCSEVLGPFAPGPLLIADAGTLEPTMMMAAARALGMGVVGVQYGGHHSYMDDHSWTNELMYPDYQAYVTWGWETPPDGESCRETRPIPLPSPWLSERGNFWRASLRRGACEAKDYDFLWLTNKMYRFPPAPRGGAVCAIDSIEEVRAMMTGLVREARAKGARILHKPYNLETMAVLAKTSSELERLGAGSYERTPNVDKGLTPDLVDRCRIVLWDQLGTGMIECFAAGIPTMALWPRDYYTRERASARELVAGLERWGLIHRTTEALFMALSGFKADPRAWLERTERRDAVSRFSRVYGWADSSWVQAWRAGLESLRPARTSP